MKEPKLETGFVDSFRQKEQREKALKALEKARKSPRKERIIPMGMTG